MELILIDDNNVEEEKERMSIILNRDIGLPMLNPEILRNMGYTVNSYVELLINCKADVNVLDQHKMSPLLYASMYGKSKVMKILIDAKANVEEKDGYRKSTSLLWASRNGHFDAVASIAC